MPRQRKIRLSRPPLDAKPREPLPRVPMSLIEAAKHWEVAPTVLRVLCRQGRLKHIRVEGEGNKRASIVLITQRDYPARADYRSLTPEQRAVKASGHVRPA